MGLTGSSTGKNILDTSLQVTKNLDSDRIIALAGNPNVGKSTVFNTLTGLNQHTGNWPGKTVGIAQGRHHYQGVDYIFVDLPGTYSLMAHSADEEVARDFLLFSQADSGVVVCDATCLERNLNLVLQTLEIMPNLVVCLNLMDEAEKKGIHIKTEMLSETLGVPVVETRARAGIGLDALMREVSQIREHRKQRVYQIQYPAVLEHCVALLTPSLKSIKSDNHVPIDDKWLALRIVAGDELLLRRIEKEWHIDILAREELQDPLSKVKQALEQAGISQEQIQDMIASAIVSEAETIYHKTITKEKDWKQDRDRKLDRILTSKKTGIPIMLVLLCFIFWLTITGSNYPSEMLADSLFWVQDRLTDLFLYLNAPDWLHGLLVLGLFRVLAWVVSVMLPPMAIFFPLFTLLEDFGYLPRVAFVLDYHFKKACACGKQALTMCMGFGCNAAGVIGCRIIDTPRERLIAILTNSFVPCNGRFPTLIAIIAMFFVGMDHSFWSTIRSSLLLTGVIVFGVVLTLLVSQFLSQTVLKGEPSSFTLELPPYRTPQLGKVLVRSLLDRTIFVLGRAVVVAAPAGLIIWVMANVFIGDLSILNHCALFLDPLGKLLGMDGIILLAFILGFPANEIVVPIMIMAYLSSGALLELDSLSEMKALFVANGWTWVTAVSTMLFCLVHWPCSTTCLTIHKEAGGLKWTLLAILLPTIIGMAICFFFTSIVRLLGLA